MEEKAFFFTETVREVVYYTTPAVAIALVDRVYPVSFSGEVPSGLDCVGLGRAASGGGSQVGLCR